MAQQAYYAHPSPDPFQSYSPAAPSTALPDYAPLTGAEFSYPDMVDLSSPAHARTDEGDEEEFIRSGRGGGAYWDPHSTANTSGNRSSRSGSGAGMVFGGGGGSGPGGPSAYDQSNPVGLGVGAGGNGVEDWDDLDGTDPWYRRRKFIILAGVLAGLAAVVALAVGLGVGLSKGKSQNLNAGGRLTTSASDANGTTASSSTSASLITFLSSFTLGGVAGVSTAVTTNNPNTVSAAAPLGLSSTPASGTAAVAASTPISQAGTNPGVTGAIPAETSLALGSTPIASPAPTSAVAGNTPGRPISYTNPVLVVEL